MASYRFHQWLTCEVETEDGTVGSGNAALALRVVKTAIDELYASLVTGEDPFDYAYIWEKCIAGPTLGAARASAWRR